MKYRPIYTLKKIPSQLGTLKPHYNHHQKVWSYMTPNILTETRCPETTQTQPRWQGIAMPVLCVQMYQDNRLLLLGMAVAHIMGARIIFLAHLV